MLSKDEYAVYLKDFRALDLDGDGYLSMEEVKAMVEQQLGRPPDNGEESFMSHFSKPSLLEERRHTSGPTPL